MSEIERQHSYTIYSLLDDKVYFKEEMNLFIFYFREFIEKDLLDFAHKYPGIVVYVKPRRHHSPCLSAEYCEFRF
jgi:hypothetical protein